MQTDGTLNYYDFERWLKENEEELRVSVSDWIPDQLKGEERGGFVGVVEKSPRPALI